MMFLSGQSSGPTLLSVIQGLGLATNLKLCLDAGDALSYVGGAISTTAGPLTQTTVAGTWGNRTVRNVIAASALSTSGTTVYVTFGGNGGGSAFVIDAAYIGEKAAAGDPYDFAATPTQITFSGGAAGFSITGADTIVSDPIAFTLDETKNYVISYHIAVSGGAGQGATVTASGWSSYWKSGSDASTMDATGYTDNTATDNALGVRQIDVVTSGNGGQKWSDRSGAATEIYRGTTPLSDSADPTFSGAIGGLSVNDYWLFGGSQDFFAASNPSWAEPFHRDGATYTIMAAYYPSGAAGVSLIGDLSIAGTGFGLRLTSSQTLEITVRNAGAVALTRASTATLTDSAWGIVGLSISENAGASGGISFVNGTTETFNPAYSSPAAGNATGVLGIGAGALLSSPPSGSRLAWVAVWDVALTASQMNNIYSQMRVRQNI